jgi:hypothetical protein
MSWNISIVKLSAHKNNLSGTEAYLLPLDTEVGVIDRLSTIFPQSKFETPTSWGTWGYLNGDDYTVQIELGTESISACNMITLHVRGWNIDGVMTHVVKPLIDHTGWQAFDMSEGKRIDFACPEPLVGIDRWKQNRSRRSSSPTPRKSRGVAVGMF